MRRWLVIDLFQRRVHLPPKRYWRSQRFPGGVWRRQLYLTLYTAAPQWFLRYDGQPWILCLFFCDWCLTVFAHRGKNCSVRGPSPIWPWWCWVKNCIVCHVLVLVKYKIQTHKRFKRTLCIRTKHDMWIFGGNPLYQATKRHLNNN